MLSLLAFFREHCLPGVYLDPLFVSARKMELCVSHLAPPPPPLAAMQILNHLVPCVRIWLDAHYVAGGHGA